MTHCPKFGKDYSETSLFHTQAVHICKVDARYKTLFGKEGAFLAASSLLFPFGSFPPCLPASQFQLFNFFSSPSSSTERPNVLNTNHLQIIPRRTSPPSPERRGCGIMSSAESLLRSRTPLVGGGWNGRERQEQREGRGVAFSDHKMGREGGTYSLSFFLPFFIFC